MSNLKGSTFEKQIKDGFYRTLAISKKLKQSQEEKLKQKNMSDNIIYYTLTKDVAIKRKKYLNDFKECLEQKGITQGKINQYMTQDLIISFLEEKTTNFAKSTALDYVAGFNSLLKALQSANVTIPANPLKEDFLKDLREVLKEEKRETINEKLFYIHSFKDKYSFFKEENELLYYALLLQYQTGLPTRYLANIFNFPNKFLKKENSQYCIKGIFKRHSNFFKRKIDEEIALFISNNTKKFSTSTYSNKLSKELKINSLSIRATFYLNKIYQNQIKSVKNFPYEHFLNSTALELSISSSSLNKYLTNEALLNSIKYLDINILKEDNYPILKLPNSTNLTLRKYAGIIITLREKGEGARRIVKYLKIFHNVDISYSTIHQFLKKIIILKK